MCSRVPNRLHTAQIGQDSSADHAVVMSMPTASSQHAFQLLTWAYLLYRPLAPSWPEACQLLSDDQVYLAILCDRYHEHFEQRVPRQEMSRIQEVLEVEVAAALCDITGKRGAHCMKDISQPANYPSSGTGSKVPITWVNLCHQISGHQRSEVEKCHQHTMLLTGPVTDTLS
jgi:hypothetical protein